MKRLLRCDDVRQASEVGTFLNQLRAAPPDARSPRRRDLAHEGA